MVSKLKIIREKLSKLPIRDSIYIYLLNLIRNKRFIAIKNPQTYTDKLFWLLNHYDFSIYGEFADKFSVRDYVKEKIGEKYLIPMYAVYDDVKQIDFCVLPDQFALKATHGSNMNVFILNKSKIRIFEIINTCKNWLNTNYYLSQREIVYKKIPPRIICEKLLFDKDGKPPVDYKFLCFNGKVACIIIDIDRFREHERNLYYPDWTLLPFTIRYPNSKSQIEKPSHLDNMIEISEKLANDFHVVRIDLYCIQDQIFFGEMTFTPYSAAPKFNYKLDEQLGKMLKID